VSAWKRRAVACAAAALVLTGSAAAAADDPLPLVEAPSCAAPTPVAAADGARTDGATEVALLVPAVTRLRVEGGAVVAAATNTGCAPRSTDQIVVGDRLATPAEVAAAVAIRWDDWTTPGEWHALGGR
jgi:hypothetical protein